MRLQSWLIIALALVLAAAGFLSLHAVRHALRMHLAAGPVRPWMSIPYIARIHHVPREKLYEAAGVPEERRDHRRLGRIARQQGRSVDELIRRLETAIREARSHDPSRVREGVP